MWGRRTSLVLLILGFVASCRAEEFEDPMGKLVADNGYPLEKHTVATPDGYLLDIHRIPYGLQSPAGPKKPVVFLMHAMYASSYSFVYLGKEHSLAFILADAGYDVWMGNTRGNVYARKNIYVSSKSAPFWQFSWHERGVIDLPAMIDYVLENTTQESLYYVSLSRGGTMFFVMTSEMPEYNDKIKLAITLAPAVFMSEPHNELENVLVQGSTFSEWVSLFLGLNEFYLSPAVADMLNIKRCSNNTVMASFCSSMYFLGGGHNFTNVNEKRFPDIAKSSSRGTSVKEMIHFGQLMTSKKFAKYNYGAVQNVYRYGATVPPSYDLSKVSTPVVTFSSKDDAVVDRSDVLKLIKELPNLVEDIYIEVPGFTHENYVMSDNAKSLIYEKLLAYLKKY